MLVGKQIERMVEQAMQDQAPRLHQELKANGTLQAYLEEKTREIEDLEEELFEPEQTRILKSNLGPMERIQQGTLAARQAWDQAVATCLTFPEATTTASPSTD